MHPDETLTRIQIDEAEPKILLDGRTWTNTQSSVGMEGQTVATENEYTAKTGLRPARRSSTEGCVVYTGGCHSKNASICWEISLNSVLDVVGECHDEIVNGNGGGANTKYREDVINAVVVPRKLGLVDDGDEEY